MNLRLVMAQQWGKKRVRMKMKAKERKRTTMLTMLKEVFSLLLGWSNSFGALGFRAGTKLRESNTKKTAATAITE